MNRRNIGAYCKALSHGNVRYFVALLIIIVIWLKPVPNLELLRFNTSGLVQVLGSTTASSSREQFVELALKHDIYTSEYNGSAVQKLCREAQWRDDRVMSCDMMAGGIGNLRPDLLACTRYAIESGGMLRGQLPCHSSPPPDPTYLSTKDSMTATFAHKTYLAILITPVLHPRQAFGKMEDSFGYDTDLPISYVFDSENYYTRLAEDCPQLRIIPEVNDPETTGYTLPPRSESYEINPKKLAPLLPPPLGDVIEDPSKWRPALDAYIDKEIIKANNLAEPSSKNPLRLSYNNMIIFSWPVSYDPADLQADWGHLAAFPRPIREMAARTLYNLYARIPGAQAQSPNAPSSKAFLGAHIRAEPDAAAMSWTSYEKQSEQIREQLVEHGLHVVYVATGTVADMERLRSDVADLRIRVNETHTRGVEVFHKGDLMDEADSAAMEGLTWDQAALVDMDVMLRASRFVGIAESSWGWMIAVKRHAWSDANPYDYEAHPRSFEDELSVLYGPTGGWMDIIPTCSWL